MNPTDEERRDAERTGVLVSKKLMEIMDLQAGQHFIVTFLLGSFLAMIAGGLVGVYMVPSVMTFVAFSGLIEGIVQGWLRYGFVGAIGGAVAGLIVGCIIGMLPVMLAHLILILFGHDIIVPENTKESHDDQKVNT